MRVGNRPVQQTRIVGPFPRVEQFARLNSWLYWAYEGGVEAGEPFNRRRGADESCSEDDRGDEQDLRSDPARHRQRDHLAYALMLPSRAPQIVRLPGLAASAFGGRERGHDVRHTARRFVPSMPVPA